nr:hypothetical protein [Haladaptatus halobius]
MEDGRVYVGSDDRRVYVLDEETGDVRTRYETFGRVVDAPRSRATPFTSLTALTCTRSERPGDAVIAPPLFLVTEIGYEWLATTNTIAIQYKRWNLL